MESFIREYFLEAEQTIRRTSYLIDDIVKAATSIINSIQNGGCVYWCGNGGSAADSQHLAAELMGKFRISRKPLRSIALTTDSSVLTAFGNDFGFEKIFARQLEGLATHGDVLVGISTSGQSMNVVNAFVQARKLGVTTIAMTGEVKSIIHEYSDIAISVPSRSTSHIQEAHILIGQLICGVVESHFFELP